MQAAPRAASQWSGALTPPPHSPRALTGHGQPCPGQPCDGQTWHGQGPDVCRPGLSRAAARRHPPGRRPVKGRLAPHRRAAGQAARTRPPVCGSSAARTRTRHARAARARTGQVPAHQRRRRRGRLAGHVDAPAAPYLDGARTRLRRGPRPHKSRPLQAAPAATRWPWFHWPRGPQPADAAGLSLRQEEEQRRRRRGRARASPSRHPAPSTRSRYRPARVTAPRCTCARHHTMPSRAADAGQ